MTKIYSHVSNTHRRRMIIALAMMAVAVTGMILSVVFMLAPAGVTSGGGVGLGVSSRVGWDEAWSDRYEYTGNFQGGNGTAGNPYLIHNAAAMARFAHDINHRDGNGNSIAHYKLVNNIDLSARRWDPVGRYEYDRRFKGTFDGNGYVISGVTSQNQGGSNNGRIAGLFGIVAGDAVIKNLKLNNSTVNVVMNSGGYTITNGGGLSVGLVAGFVDLYSNVRFENIEINSGRINIPSSISVAGIDAGALLGATSSDRLSKITAKDIKISNTKIITSASNNDEYSADWRQNSIGGLVGRVTEAADISNITINGSDITSANVTKGVSLGGLIGDVEYVFQSNLNVSDITITGTRLNSRAQAENRVGGLIGRITGNVVGRINNIIIEDGITITAVASDTTRDSTIMAGGVVAKIESTKACEFNNLRFEGKISLDGLTENTKHTLNAGGIMGIASYTDMKINKSIVDAEINASDGVSKSLGGLVGWTNSMVSNAILNIDDATAVGRIASIGATTNMFGSAIGSVNTPASGVSLNNVRTSVNGVSGLALISNNQDATIFNSWQQVLVAPAIEQQPAEITRAIIGGNVVLSVKANNMSDQSNLTYQWYKSGGAPLGGAIQDTLSLQAGNEGTTSYYVKVSANLLGLSLSTNSIEASVVVERAPVTPPTITQQPTLFNKQGSAMSANELKLGDIATLEIKATASKGNLSYQWFKGVGNNTGGMALAGQTNSVLTVSTDVSGTQHYYVEVTSKEADGRTATVASSSVSVLVLDQNAPTITLEPVSTMTVLRNTSSMLTVSAMSSDNSELRYQWYTTNIVGAAGTEIVGATAPYLMIDTSIVGTKHYYVEVIGVVGNNTKTNRSTDSMVTVIVPQASAPEITDLTQDQGVIVGDQINLNVTAVISEGDSIFSSDGALHYQWYRNAMSTSGGGQPIQGATTATYTFEAEEEGTFYFYVEVTNVLTVDDSIKSTISSDVIQVVVTNQLDQQSIGLFTENLPWIVVIVGSAGVMFAAFVMIVKKSVVEY